MYFEVAVHPIDAAATTAAAHRKERRWEEATERLGSWVMTTVDTTPSPVA
jgi:hypothetical protein